MDGAVALRQGSGTAAVRAVDVGRQCELLAQVEGAHEPYRALLRSLQQRLDASRRHIEELLRATPPEQTARSASYASLAGYTWEPEMFEPVSELIEPLLLCYRSLHATGNGIIADGRLTDVLRRMAAFGVTLVRLDLRQEAERHTEAVTRSRARWVRRSQCWSEERRVDFLVTVLAQDRKLTPPRMPMNARVAEVLDTFRMLAAVHPESLGAYIITMAGKPSTSSPSSCCSARPASLRRDASSRCSRLLATCKAARR